MENLWIHNMQKVLNNLKNPFLDGITKKKLMTVMAHNYMRVRNALHVKMFYLHIQVEIGHSRKENQLSNVNTLIFKIMEDFYSQKNSEKKKDHHNTLP